MISPIGLLFITQLVLTLYGAGLRRPFGSFKTIEDAPTWLRDRGRVALALDSIFVAFLLFMWWRLLHELDLLIFLIAFFVFAGIGTLLANHLSVVKSSAISLACALLAIYVVFGDGS